MGIHIIACGSSLGLEHVCKPRGRFDAYSCPGVFRHWRSKRILVVMSRFNATAVSHNNSTMKLIKFDNLLEGQFASISSVTEETSAVGACASPMPPPPSDMGYPLFWVGVGIGLAAFYRFVVTNLKKYTTQRGFKAMEGEMISENSEISSTKMEVVSGSDMKHVVGGDMNPTEVEEARAHSATQGMTQGSKSSEHPLECAFEDVCVDQTKAEDSFQNTGDITVSPGMPLNNIASKNKIPSKSHTTKTRMDNKRSEKTNPTFSVEVMEKMMSDPKIQNIVYPYLPKEMRNPDMFKWMMQNPQCRQQFEDMMKNLPGNNQQGTGMADFAKNFDINSPHMKQKFAQFGQTPESIFKIMMENPEITLALRNPRVQAAMFEFSQNPQCISKYENDKEIMLVFNVMTKAFGGNSGAS